VKILTAVAAALAAALGGAGVAGAAELPAVPMTAGVTAVAELPAVPTIAGPTAVAEHTLARFEARDVSPKAALLWRVTPAEKVDRATTPRGRLEFVAPAGEYAVELLVITVGADGSADVAEVRQRVRVGTPPGAPPGTTPPPVKPPTKADPVNAIGRITFGRAGCTATVIAPRRADGRWDVLTAAHCTETGVGSKGSMSFKDGRKVGVTVARRDERADVCWLVTDSAELGELPFAELAAELPAAGTPVWHMGYGVDRPGTRARGSRATGRGPRRRRSAAACGRSGSARRTW
jgi:hypothetical protein